MLIIFFLNETMMAIIKLILFVSHTEIILGPFECSEVVFSVQVTALNDPCSFLDLIVDACEID